MLKGICLDIYIKYWHWNFQRVNPNWKQSEMYTNGQFDEIPYSNFKDFENKIRKFLGVK
jgi:hypothetical protein